MEKQKISLLKVGINAESSIFIWLRKVIMEHFRNSYIFISLVLSIMVLSCNHHEAHNKPVVVKYFTSINQPFRGLDTNREIFYKVENYNDTVDIKKITDRIVDTIKFKSKYTAYFIEFMDDNGNLVNHNEEPVDSLNLIDLSGYSFKKNCIIHYSYQNGKLESPDIWPFDEERKLRIKH